MVHQYLYVYFMLSGKANDFQPNHFSTPQNLPYDYESIMHFHPYTYSTNHKPTLQPLSDSIPESCLGMSDTPTQLDYLHINLLYGQGMSIFQQSMQYLYIKLN